MKKGVTLTSLVIYLLLFFVFTAVTVTFTSNNNKNMFLDRGNALNYTALNKLQYNLANSENGSKYFNKIGNNIVFSNGDAYSYDSGNKQILLNGGVLIDNVDSCILEYSKINGGSYLKYTITLNKYSSSITKDVELFMEEEL